MTFLQIGTDLLIAQVMIYAQQYLMDDYEQYWTLIDDNEQIEDLKFFS